MVWVFVTQVSKLDKRRGISAGCWSIGGGKCVQKLHVAQESGYCTVPFWVGNKDWWVLESSGSFLEQWWWIAEAEEGGRQKKVVMVVREGQVRTTLVEQSLKKPVSQQHH